MHVSTRESPELVEGMCETGIPRTVDADAVADNANLLNGGYAALSPLLDCGISSSSCWQ